MAITFHDQLAHLTNWHECDGYREQFSPTDSEAIRIFNVEWSTRKLFVDAVLGYSENSNKKLLRHIPAQHPQFPHLYATSCEMMAAMGATKVGNIQSGFIEYFNNDPSINEDAPLPPITVTDEDGNVTTTVIAVSDSIREGIAQYKVTYRSLPYQVKTDDEVGVADWRELYRYIQRETVYSLQSLPTPINQLKFTEGAYAKKSITSSAGNKLFPTRELTYIWHQVPDIPEDAFSECEGTVNKAEFDPFFQYPAETLLCLAPQRKWQRDVKGEVTWTITYKFLYRPQGHNYFPVIEDDKLKFRLATYGGKPTGERLYSSSDFNKLFQLPKHTNYDNL